MDEMKEFQLRMQLLEGKEIRFCNNIPGNNKKELIEKAISSLQEYLKRMEDSPDYYEETDPDPWFNLSIELLKVPKPKFM